MPNAKLLIGTSNVVIPGNKKTFPERYRSTSRLHYYSTLFNSVEVNSSFYKIPLSSTWLKWAADVPDDFKFTVKLSKEITHTKNLESDLSVVIKFMQAAHALGTKKGVLLIQFPGKITLDYFSKVENILAVIEDANEKREWQTAVEFRNPSWYIAETNEMIHQSGSIIVCHDHPKARFFATDNNSKFVYLRFHGPKGDYRGSYTDSFLKDQSVYIRQYIKEAKVVYVYFNNTIGNAFENARTLQAMCFG